MSGRMVPRRAAITATQRENNRPWALYNRPMSHSAARWFSWLLLLAALAAAYWYFFARAADPVPVEVLAPVKTEGADSAGPQHPLPPGPEQSSDPARLIPLPPLDDSDGYFKLALEDLFGDSVGEILVNRALIEKLVATVDNLPRSQVAERIRPAGAPLGDFEVLPGENEETFVLGPSNYERYDAIANRLAGADPDRVVETYRRFYPLLQEAYVGLGYPGKYFNDRVVEVIDHLLATPQIEGPIRLVRPNVLFEFADPGIQALSAGQKLMIRIGNDNAAKVRRLLEAVRVRIAAA